MTRRPGKPAVLAEQRVLVHTSLQSVRWGDMDMLGHVNNNTVYFRYMEQGRIEWVDRRSGRPVPLPASVPAPMQGPAS